MAGDANVNVSVGDFFPLGASLRDGGVNFAIYSRNAEGVDLILFDKPSDASPTAVISIKNKTRFVWHCFVEGLKPGQLYAYRVKGDYRPQDGLRFNYARLLMDPYAKAITGKFDPKWCHLGYDPDSALADLSFNSQDNAAHAPKCIVVDDGFDWEGDRPARVPMQDTIIYEAHPMGLTAHKSSGVKHPGTYLGVIEKVPYLKSLGITSVEFLPVHHCHEEDYHINKGLTNYWGYNTLGFFAPDSRYGTGSHPGCQVSEFKEMVKALHKAGLEVILDVVYNHSCEGNEKGPTLCFKGIDNPTYYNLAGDKRYYNDYSGCGNSLNYDEPQVVKLIMDSLRYWVEVMHVDGFRFDLASALGREEGRFDQVGKFFTAINQDPALSHVKLIAEPWDTSWEGYKVGNFPVDWAEWNGRYRDSVRKYVKGEPGMLAEMGYRLTGSSDFYGDDGRSPYHCINFITCHDGFTMSDLVSYAGKHNEANLDNNGSGEDKNNSWNWGVEGETQDPEINGLRRRLVKGFFAMLMVSQGVPMVLGGDEFMRTQKGNNNAYCQDNEISHFDWSLADKNADIVEFVSRLIAFRRRHPHFRKRSFFTGQDTNLDKIKDINWYDENLNPPDWGNPEKRCLAFMLQGEELAADGGCTAEDIMVLMNMHWEDRAFLLPELTGGERWQRALDTTMPSGQEFPETEHADTLPNQGSYTLPARGVAVLVSSKAG